METAQAAAPLPVFHGLIGLTINEMPCGGYLVSEAHRPDSFNMPHAAFSSLSEALDFIKRAIENAKKGPAA